jgi:GTP-binding protein
LLKKQQAVVADRAGTTRDVNKVSIKYETKNIQLMDTAGIRRSGKIGQGIEHFSVIRTLSAIESSDICLLLVDVNELSVQLDQKIAGMVKDANKGLIIVVSKWDSLSDKSPFIHDELIPKIKYHYQFVPWAPLVFTSSITGQNMTKLLSLSLEIFENRNRKIKTSELNKFLRDAVAKHPPAGLKNTAPKLNYMMQEDDNDSPNFKIYGSHTRYLHWSYKRFLEKEIRENYNFVGTAIKLWFFEKHIDRLKKPAKLRPYRNS